MARRTLTDRQVANLQPRAARYAFPDPELAGLYVRVTPNGAKSYAAVARAPGGRQVWTTLGSTSLLTIDEARAAARAAIRRVKAGLAAVEPPALTFKDVAEQWVTRHVRANGLRTAYEIERMLNRVIYPAWENRAFTSIRRSDVTVLLDAVQDKHGARQADCALTIVRAVMNWHAVRSDNYTPAVVRGMKRQSFHAQARSRILDDDELRALWAATADMGAYGNLARLALLTGQRRGALVGMRWADIDLQTGLWTLPVEHRAKRTAGALPLPPLALSVVMAQPRLVGNDYVLAGQGHGHIRGYTRSKLRLDARLPGMAPWVFHDLRRTARSLLSRAGVRPDVAERVLGHAIGGIESVYNRHTYMDEKRDALVRLASLVERIANPPGDNVLPIRAL